MRGKLVRGVGDCSEPLPDACPLLRARAAQFGHSLDIFDFSERHMMRRAAEVVIKVDGEPRPPSRPLLVEFVGDALQEPFWPEGLGINRGMHNALDACWVANQWAEGQASPARAAQLIEERQQLYKAKTLQMHGKNRKMLLGYTADNSPKTAPAPAYHYSPHPESRYVADRASQRRQSSLPLADSPRAGRFDSPRAGRTA